MHDEFLHRLRKDPSPEFAARLRSRLRRHCLSPLRPGAASRARTLLILLLLGGTAFAVTSVVMRGFPRPIVELYQHTIVRLGAGHTLAAGHRADGGGILEGLRWGASWASPPRSAIPHSQPAHSAAAGGSAGPSATSAGTAADESAPGGALLGSEGAEVKVLTSWAAYPYASAVAERLGSWHVDVSVGNSADWRDWPQAMCTGKASAPNVAYVYEPVGTVSARPCTPYPTRNLSSVISIPLGYEAVVLARSPLYGALDLTRRDLFLALAKWVPDPAKPGTVHQNTSTLWRQIDAAQGPERVQLMGPQLSSATGRSMIELLMEAGCDTYPWIAALKSTAPDKYARICRTVRTDGVYTEAYSLQASDLLAEPNAVGIFGFADLMNLNANLAESRLDGVMPTAEDIASGAYPASRGIYLYVNRYRVPQAVVLGFVGDDLSAFPRNVLVPLPPAQRRAAFRAAAIY